jgi:murein DD-endopeptidase MepM/ murein hydrolase activator NlpD
MIKLRGQDCHGDGCYGAKRGHRTHNGIDIISHANEVVVAYEGGRVSRIGYPYSPNDPKKNHFRYVEICTADGSRHRYFYCADLVDVGDVVERGQTIGSSQTLTLVYPGITQHIHYEVKDKQNKYIDPVPVLEGLGYEVEV